MEKTNQKQRQEILEYLQHGGRLTTLYACEVMGIMHPAARILELKNDGYNIVTYRNKGCDVTGSNHRIAEYVFLTGNPQPDNNNQTDMFAA